MNRKIATYAIFRHFLPILWVFGLLSAAIPAQAGHDFKTATGQPHLQTTGPTGRIVVHLAPTAGLRLGAAGLQVHEKATAKRQAADNRLRINALIASLAPGAQIAARMPTAAQAVDKAGAASPYAHLALYAHFDTGLKNPLALAKLAARLQADPAIDLAWAEPVATPAMLDFGQDISAGATAPPSAAIVSASFDSLQGYLADAPDGIGALSMRSQAGALGAGVTVIDVEGAWLWAHEDLPTPVAEIGLHINDIGWRNHGTAVVGVIRGQDNGIGVTGIVPDCAVGNSSIGSQATAEAILAAAQVLSPGDVIVIELHAPGPEATGVGQQGYLPMEFWQDNFDAMLAVTRQGIMVLEAAGNGQVDLDAAIYQGLFDPALRHSGAIMIGATNGVGLDPAWFTNHGQRVDLNGWGFNVATLAYGDLQGDPAFPEDQWYTAQFSGTSSATPVVTGAVVSLTGMVRARHGFDLDARLARDLLLVTGTPAVGAQMIGSRPDLVAAYALADNGIGEVVGVVTDQVSSLPIGGVLVAVSNGGATTLTAVDGSWRLPLLTGAVDLEFTEFAYEAGGAAAVISVGSPAVADVALVPVARVDITGVVYGGGNTLASAQIDPLQHPITPAVSLLNGSFILPQVPVGLDEKLLVHGVPGFGARVVDVSTVGAVGTVNTIPILNAIDEDFGLGDGGFVSTQGLWTHGVPPASPANVASAFTGTQCWGIGMDGLGYADDQADTLTSPVYDLSTVDPGPYFLSFHYFSDTEANFDGVHLEVSTGGAFTVLVPVEGYSDLFLGGLEQQSGWSGVSSQWTGSVFDISALTGGSLQFRLNFGSDAGVTGPGFYIDGITFGDALEASPAPGAVPQTATASLKAWPNPFNPVVNIAYELTQPGALKVTIFDLAGRKVRQLYDARTGVAAGRLQWNGRDDAGQPAASGVYLVRLQGPAGDHATQRVVLTK